MTTVTYIDPPSGWKYGFPKPIPSGVGEDDLADWLVANGYPRRDAENLLYCRYWSEEVEEAGDELSPSPLTTQEVDLTSLVS